MAPSQAVKDDGDGETTVGGPDFGEIRRRGVGSKQDLDVTALGGTVQCLRQDTDEALGEALADPGANRTGEVNHYQKIGASSQIASSRWNVESRTSWALIPRKPNDVHAAWREFEA